MNIPVMKDETNSLFNLAYFSHNEEMENFSKHIYLDYKGARTGVIGGNDPFEDTIIGISPKVFTLLMLARFNMCFRPAPSNPLVGIMLEVPVSFGRFNVFSTRPKCWFKPTDGTQHLGFTMNFKQHSKALATIITGEHPKLLEIPDPKVEQLILGSIFTIREDTYLSDICDEVCGLLKQLSEVNKKLSTLS